MIETSRTNSPSGTTATQIPITDNNQKDPKNTKKHISPRAGRCSCFPAFPARGTCSSGTRLCFQLKRVKHVCKRVGNFKAYTTFLQSVCSAFYIQRTVARRQRWSRAQHSLFVDTNCHILPVRFQQRHGSAHRQATAIAEGVIFSELLPTLAIQVGWRGGVDPRPDDRKGVVMPAG